MKKTFAIAILLASGSVLASTAAPDPARSQAQVRAAADQTAALVQATSLKRTTRSVAEDDNRQIMKLCPWVVGDCIYYR